ncbi:MAG TPA: peptidylprolyl isomerase [Terriglobales bacterium]|jgi:FKBP-type peptidyl-prolyl cis-trans isomerase 2|nr:peptidylprolyl isomerase [Terriglobales bacterium]
MGIIRARSTARVFVLFVGLFFNCRAFAQTTSKSQNVVQDGAAVSFDYTLTDDDGKVIDSSKGKQPMSYTHGKGEIIPGLERELTGLKVGAEKKVKVKPEDAYGPINPQAFQEVPKEKLPPEALKVGTVLMAQGPQGQGVPVRVHEIKDKTVVMDFNHPLAGKTLSFDVKITDIKPPQ